MAHNNKQKKEYKTLLSVLANGSTEKAVDLLKKYTGEVAYNTKDLELKLARAYASSTSKKDIEKEFAEIHPHKDFILKYIQPKVDVSSLKPDALITPNNQTEKTDTTGMVMLHDGYANANGETHAPCGNSKCNYCKRYFSNCCGDQNNTASLNASGEISLQGATPSNNILILGLVSIVAIASVVMYLKSTK